MCFTSYFVMCFVLILSIFCNCNASNNEVSRKVPILRVSQGGFNYYPSISPNNKYVAYLHMIDEDITVVGNIWVFDLTTQERTRVSDLDHLKSYDSYPTWTPDSKKIIFSSGGSFYEAVVENGKVDELLSIESNNAYVFAPNISADGTKIAFWVRFNIDSDQRHAVWVLDRDVNAILKLPDLEYGPQTEVTWFKPQFIDSGQRVVSTFYPKSHVAADCHLAVVDLNTKEIMTLMTGLYSSFFRVFDNQVYYTRQINGQVKLFAYDVKSKKESLVLTALNGVFDVGGNQQSTVIVFARDEVLYLLRQGQIDKVGIQGSNPQLHKGLLIYEVWNDESPQRENSILAVRID